MTITSTSRPSDSPLGPPTMGRMPRRHGGGHERPRHGVDDEELRRQAFTAQAGTLLASTLDDGDWYLQGLADLAVPTFADWCVVETAGAKGTFRVRAEAHADDLKLGLATELRRVRPRDAGSVYGVSDATKTGRAALVTDVCEAITDPRLDDPEDLRIYASLGVCSALFVPIVDSGRAVQAVICMFSLRPQRRFTLADLRAMEKLACSATAALDHAQRFSRSDEIVRASTALLTDTAGHELRTPLSALLLQLESLNAKLSRSVPVDHEVLRRGVNRAFEQANRLRDGVEKLVGSARRR